MSEALRTESNGCARSRHHSIRLPRGRRPFDSLRSLRAPLDSACHEGGGPSTRFARSGHHSIRPATREACARAQAESSGAEGGTRTPTVLLPPAPQAGASANSATSARRAGTLERVPYESVTTSAASPGPAASALVRPAPAPLAYSSVALRVHVRRSPSSDHADRQCRDTTHR